MIDRRRLLLGGAAAGAVAAAGGLKVVEALAEAVPVDLGVITPLAPGVVWRLPRGYLFLDVLDPKTGLPVSRLRSVSEVREVTISSQTRWLERPVVAKDQAYRITHPDPVDDDED